MATLFLINNQVVDSHQPYFPPSFRGYRYGDGFFESMRFDNGRVLHLLLHAERIRKSALLLKLNLPSGWDEIAWETQIATLCQKSGFNQARIRLSFIRDTDGFYTPDNNEVCVITEILEEEKSGYPWLEKGLSVGTYKEMSKNSNYTSSLKTCSSLLYTMAGIYAKERGLDECLIFNEYGRPCEGVSTNVFIVANEFVITPPISEYCIDGIMRKVVMQLAVGYGYSVQERPITEVELSAADEIFFTTATRGILWTANYQGKPMKNSVSKVLYDQLVKSL